VVAATEEQVRQNLERHGIEVIRGDAALGPERTVRVGDRVLHAQAVLIATGSRPHHPAGIPFEDPDVDDSDEILSLHRLPGTMVVIGGGAVGCEYASIFNALGTTVTLADARERLVPFLDGEVSAKLAESFRSDGMDVRTGTGVREVARDSGPLEVRLDDGEALRPDKVLVAAGRAGNVEGLGLDVAGVEADERGRIQVDETYRTTAEGIYAAGDVIGSPSLASVGMEQGRVAVCHALGMNFKEAVDRFAPFGVFTIPEAAMVGLTEEAAREASLEHEVGVARFATNPRSQITGGTDGFLKLVFRPADRVLLGAHILGDLATELIHVGQAVLHDGGTIDRFITATYNVPSRTDAYKYAAYDGLQRLARRAIG
jgi:NAD(P) transhydrogenase